MKKSAIAWVILALSATALPSQSLAQNRSDDAAFERMDADKSGDLSLEELVAGGNPRITAADTDGDGNVTLEQITASFKGSDAAAQEFMGRFDTDKDGVISRVEVEARRTSNFKLLDVNSDGKLVKDEMPAGAR